MAKVFPVKLSKAMTVTAEQLVVMFSPLINRGGGGGCFPPPAQ